MTVYADLYRFRELFANLFRRDFHAKYKGSLLGIVWSLLNPLLLLAVYLVVFGVLFPNAKTPHYPIYLLGGLACWLFFSVSLQSAARSMIDSGELIKKVRFPRQLVAFSIVATQAVTFAVMIAILLVLSARVRPGGAVDGLGRRSRSRSLFLGLVAGLSLLVAVPERAAPRHRAHPHGGAAALVLPHADPLARRAASPTAHSSITSCSTSSAGATSLAPPIFAIRDALWSGHLPRIADVVYLCVAAALALALGAFVFRRVDDRIALEL